MSWTEFIKYTGILYFAYYAVNILIDILWADRPKGPEKVGEVLHFPEETQPVTVESMPVQPPATVSENADPQKEGREAPKWERGEYDTEELTLTEENNSETTGGVFRLAQLISLAKAKTIIYKEKLVF